MKSKLQWKPWEVQNARNTRCLQRRAAGGESVEPKRKVLWAATNKDTQVASSKHSWTHVIPLHAPDASHAATEPSIALGFILFFSISLRLSFGTIFFLNDCTWGLSNLLFNCYQCSQLRVSWVLGRLLIWIFTQCWNFWDFGEEMSMFSGIHRVVISF